MNSSGHKPTSQGIDGTSAGDQANFGNPTYWLAQNFAHLWYADTCTQARDPSINARRREIIFAVACAESYLAEWLRDVIVPECANAAYAAIGKQGLLGQWKKLPKALLKAGKIEGAPDLGGVTWQNFQKIIRFRDGLIHGRASRAYIPASSAQQTMPKIEELKALKPGCARNALRHLIDELDSAAGTAPPNWL